MRTSTYIYIVLVRHFAGNCLVTHCVDLYIVLVRHFAGNCLVTHCVDQPIFQKIESLWVFWTGIRQVDRDGCTPETPRKTVGRVAHGSCDPDHPSPDP